MNSDAYPLEELVIIKQRRLEAAEKKLLQKKTVLSREEEKLASLEKKRDEVKEHYTFKINQLRESLDLGEKIEKIQQMKSYLKIVSENLKREEIKVEAQEKVVVASMEEVRIAKEELFAKQKDVEKLKIHRKEWKKDVAYTQNRKEERENDEMGSIKHLLKKFKHPKKKG